MQPIFSSRPTSVLIIGAGLAGLTAARVLARRKVPFHIVEARGRVGGRAYTSNVAEGASDSGGLDLGATWYWPHHTRLQRLLTELDIRSFPQYQAGDALFDQGPEMPPRRFRPTEVAAPPLRVVGGVQRICDRLAADLPPDTLSLHTVVEAVEASDASVIVQARNRDGERISLESSYVIITLPPRLAASRLHFVPGLPADLQQVMLTTPTWMSRAMKCLLVYEAPFWRHAGLSGHMVSSDGPVGALHDASTADNSAAALLGFLSNHPSCRGMAWEERRQAVVQQLARLFGPAAAPPLQYLELDWTTEPFTSLPDETLDAQGVADYGHPLLQEPLWEGRLWWAGTETARKGGGYLEGAVLSGERVATQLARRRPQEV